MKILVTGATGFIGSNLLNKLLSYNFDLTCYIRNPKYKSELESKGCKVIIGELSEYNKLVKSLKNVDIVIHLVGIGNVAESSNEAYQLYKKVNVEGTKTVAEASVKAKVKKFIYLSSIAAMGSKCDGIMDEDSQSNPVMPYEKSKWESELLLHNIANKSKLQIFILRPTWVMGRGDRGKDIIRLIKMIQIGLIPLVDGGQCYTPITSVDSVVNAIICCINKKIDGYRTYIISDKNLYQQRELIHMITNSLTKHNLISKKPIIIPIPKSLILIAGASFEVLTRIFKIPSFISRKRAHSMSQNRRYSIARAQKELGFLPSNVSSSIEDEIKWLKDEKKI